MTSIRKTDTDGAARTESSRRSGRSASVHMTSGCSPGAVRMTRATSRSAYAASIGLEVPVGSHGTGVVRRDRGAGAFVGDVERQRKGS